MKSLMLLWQEVADELATRCSVSTARDLKTVTSRVEHEGVSFLTITLPAYAKDFERSLETGQISPDAFAGFERARSARGLPAFLSGFLEIVFDSRCGSLLMSSDFPTTRQVEAIYAVRQLTLMFGKMLLDCAPRRIAAALEGYIDCEKEVHRTDEILSPQLLQELREMSVLLFRDVLAQMDNDVYSGNLVPRHGPGATADRLRGNTKFDQQEWTTRLEDYFPYGEFCLPNWRYHSRLRHVDFLEPGAERPVKVITVPKTLKTPRIIAVEPTCMQYTQQAIAMRLVEYLQSDPLLSKGGDGGGMIGFDDQVPNQRMAKEGSLSGKFATLDLSEASDRVSNLHVRTMLCEDRFPWLAGAVQACRSTSADVPGHGIIPLVKFASMGSALCFPVEAMVFTSIVFLGIQRAKGPLTRRDIQSLARSVRVYGDDIIVPVEYTLSVIQELEAFGYKVNTRKSFWNGLFRESCGKEYYAGQDVSIVRCRRVPPASLTDVRELMSQVSLRNQFYMAGMWKTAAWLDQQLEKILPQYPTVKSDSNVLGRHTLLDYQVDRVSRDTHSPLVKGYVENSKPPPSKVSGEGALLKWFLKQSEQPFADRNHLERSGRPDAVNIKLRWVSPF